MLKTRTHYRGYILEQETYGTQWLVRAKPSRPDLPILGRGFVIKPRAQDAAVELECRIDRLLSAVAMSA